MVVQGRPVPEIVKPIASVSTRVCTKTRVFWRKTLFSKRAYVKVPDTKQTAVGSIGDKIDFEKLKELVRLIHARNVDHFLSDALVRRTEDVLSRDLDEVAAKMIVGNGLQLFSKRCTKTTRLK